MDPNDHDEPLSFFLFYMGRPDASQESPTRAVDGYSLYFKESFWLYLNPAVPLPEEGVAIS